MSIPPRLSTQFAGIGAKLDRAEELIEAFDADWDKWTAEHKPFRSEHEIGNDGKRAIFTLRILQPIPPRFGVIAGEVVHDVRSALDHLACYLVELHGSKPTLVTAWPVEPSEWSWKRKVERRVAPWQFLRKKGKGPLGGIPPTSEAWALIQGAQPYVRSDKARDDALWGLHQLWNADKHRAISFLPLYTDPQRLLDGFTFNPAVEPIRRKALAPANRALKDGTKLALFEFADPLPKMEMEFTLPLQIAMSDDKGTGGDIQFRDTIQTVRDLYEQVGRLSYPPK